MQIQNYEELKLGSEMFQEIRDSFDVLLQKLFKKMEDNNSDEGMIDLKLTIGIRPEWIPDQDALGGSRQINMPVIRHKITTQVPVKDALDGTKDTGMALVYDDELKRYVLKYVSIDGQMSIFDMNEPEPKDEADVVANAVEVPEMFEGNRVYQIEDKESTEAANSSEASDGPAEVVDVVDEEIIDVPEENGAEGDIEAYDDDYSYEDPGYDEPC